MQDSQQIFKLHSEYQPTGDQPQAIEKLVKGFKEGNQFETLLGVTGSGKTFTMANVIQQLNKPTLIIAHNKTLAAQLYGEMKEFFPHNAVEYFVSYYDYYQPEAYVPSTDTYIAKDSAINEEIDKLRLSATAALTERSELNLFDTAGLRETEDAIGSGVYLSPNQVLQILRDLEQEPKVLEDLEKHWSDGQFAVLKKALTAAAELGTGLLEATEVVEPNPLHPNESTCYSNLFHCDRDGVYLYIDMAMKQIAQAMEQNKSDP